MVAGAFGAAMEVEADRKRSLVKLGLAALSVDCRPVVSTVMGRNRVGRMASSALGLVRSIVVADWKREPVRLALGNATPAYGLLQATEGWLKLGAAVERALKRLIRPVTLLSEEEATVVADEQPQPQPQPQPAGWDEAGSSCWAGSM